MMPITRRTVGLLALTLVLAVTAGRRFVLLSFLFGEEAPRPE